MEKLYSDSSVCAEVELPSKGLLYNGRIPGGMVKIRATTAREEKLLYGGKGSPSEKLANLLSYCVDLPQGIKQDEILVSDRFFLLLKIRMLSFGANYPIKVKCPECSLQFVKEFDLTTLIVKSYGEDESISEPFLVVLPVLQKEVGFRLLRGRDEDAIHRAGKSQAMRGGEDDSYTYSIARAIVSLDKKELSPKDAIEFVEQLISKDTTALRHAIEEKESGVETEIAMECPGCGFTIEEGLPFTDEFFRPKRKPLRSSAHPAI